MATSYAVGLPTVGEFGDVHGLVGLAVAAEQHGWDGVHLWDHVLYHKPSWPVASPVVAAGAIAAATSRVRIILTVALSRRQVQDVSQDTAGIDALSRRRLRVLATIGSMDREYSEFGLDADLRRRGRALDERLDRLVELWSRWMVPLIPNWCGGRWPHRPGLRRAARFNGAMPTFAHQRQANVPIEEFTAAASFVRQHAPGVVDIALEGATNGSQQDQRVAAYANAGATWWIEALGWWRGDLDAARSRVSAGPPTPHARVNATPTCLMPKVPPSGASTATARSAALTASFLVAVCRNSRAAVRRLLTHVDHGPAVAASCSAS